ncbi:MAG TPA: SLC13 family permease [Bacteroidales bacterium]|nr:SLC13 family permease [Bacteroidales bacterium]HPT02722.1 SLC13 family permease [Bacteroidales bacterium]
MKKSTLLRIAGLSALLVLAPVMTFAATTATMPMVFGIRIEFILFALTLVGVAVFHHKTMYVALIGLAAILITKYIFMPGEFSLIDHIIGTPGKEGEWRILLNLLGLLLGFAILAKYFEESGVPDWLPRVLPNDWKGGLVLLFAIMFISSFLDNIAAAMIGGAIAMVVFKGKVHIGYLAAIVAASNAGGAGSVVGDTTTTLMWIDGVNPLDVTHAFIASIVAFCIFGTIGSIQQDRYQHIQKDESKGYHIDWGKLGIVLLILVCAILTNWLLDFPAAGVWIAILIGTFIRRAPWNEIPKSIQGTIFLMALVTCASLMPVDQLPAASWQTAFSLGFVSAVFDNIPLTKLCLDQGGYDWGILAYTVGFGGSMIWFGSSAGVALSNMYPEAKSVIKYVKHGWHVSLAYIISFFVMLGIVGWHPHAPHRKEHQLQQQELANPPAAATVNDTTAQVN